MADISRRAVQAIGAYFQTAVNASSIGRLDVSDEAWNAAYRIEIPGGATWGQVGAVLETMAEDDVLVKEIGRGRGTQVVTEFALGEARGRRANVEYASLSHADKFKVAMYQAASVADDWNRRYKHARVFSVVLYFR